MKLKLILRPFGLSVPSSKLLHEPGQTNTASCNIYKSCMKNLTVFKFEPTTHPTGRNTSQQGSQTRATVLRPTMLRHFALKCCDRLAAA